MAALPLVYWSTGDANAAHSSSRVNGAHKQAMAATGWALAALSRWHDSGVGSMEMMLVESPGCHADACLESPTDNGQDTSGSR